MEYATLVRGNETTAGQQPMLVGSCMPQTWVCTLGKLNPIYKGPFTLVNYRVFLLFTAGNSKVQGLLSSFSLQVIQNQKQIRTELHRLKFNQGIKKLKADSKRTVMQKVKLTFVPCIFLFTSSSLSIPVTVWCLLDLIEDIYYILKSAVLFLNPIIG